MQVRKLSLLGTAHDHKTALNITDRLLGRELIQLPLEMATLRPVVGVRFLDAKPPNTVRALASQCLFAKPENGVASRCANWI